MLRAALFVAFVAVCGIAAAIRLPELDRRVVHGDEAIHFVKFGWLWTSGVYEYDPHDYHGPTLYYATLPIAAALGVEDIREFEPRHFRIVPALFGIATLLLLPLFRDGIGRLAVVAAAALLAVSPALSFYSRDYIQETLLGFLSIALLAFGWRYVRSSRAGWLLAAGICVGLMHATKETAVLALGCAGLALFVTAGPAALRRSLFASARGQRWLLFSLGLAAFVSIACFSVGFTQIAGPLDSVRAFGLYLGRADGAGLHAQPWWWYLGTLFHVKYAGGPHWSEAMILGLAALGGGLAFKPPRPSSSAARRAPVGLPRFLAIYTLTLTVAYSLIPYKTPWCSVQFLLPMTLLAGYAVRRSVQSCRTAAGRAAWLAAFVAGWCQLAGQALRANFAYANDDRNPHVYAHPTQGVVRLADWVTQLAALQAGHGDWAVFVISKNPWPLPWYLRRIANVGYWESPNCDAPVIIVDTALAQEVAAVLRGTFHESHYGLRRGSSLTVFVEDPLWQAFLNANRAP